MIKELYIENFIIIDKAIIEFEKGLNIITGETGSGKSILIDGINLLLGGRADKSLILRGKDKSIIEGTFYISQESSTRKVLDYYGVEHLNDENIIISREINNKGQSIARINGRNVTVNIIREVVSDIIDIQGQNDNSKIFSMENQIGLIDRIGGNNLLSRVEEINSIYRRVKALDLEIESMYMDEIEKERKIELLKFQLDEIKRANLSEEDENINDIYKTEIKKQSQKKIIEESIYLLSGLGSNDSNSLNRNMVSLEKNILNLDTENPKSKDIKEKIYNIKYELEELGYLLQDLGGYIAIEFKDIQKIEERLNIVNSLKRKYGHTIEDINDYMEKISLELDNIYILEDRIEEKKKEKKTLLDEFFQKSEVITQERKKVSDILVNKIDKELKTLNMKDSIFKISIEDSKEIGKLGKDLVSFKISTNKGQDLRDISKVLSGGELSRIMLAFKNIIGNEDDISTMIFDEIDTGVSGVTAQIIGEKILELSKIKQIICVTHLPQIASMGDRNFRISKGIGSEMTTVSIDRLEKEEVLDEINRLIGGNILGDTGKKHAFQLLKYAEELKKNYYHKIEG